MTANFGSNMTEHSLKPDRDNCQPQQRSDRRTWLYSESPRSCLAFMKLGRLQ